MMLTPEWIDELLTICAEQEKGTYSLTVVGWEGVRHALRIAKAALPVARLRDLNHVRATSDLSGDALHRLLVAVGETVHDAAQEGPTVPPHVDHGITVWWRDCPECNPKPLLSLEPPTLELIANALRYLSLNVTCASREHRRNLDAAIHAVTERTLKEAP